MPATVQFDRELCGRTVEIQNVAVQRMLTAKFVACKVAVHANAAKESWGDAPECCCAEGAVSIISLGQRPRTREVRTTSAESAIHFLGEFDA